MIHRCPWPGDDPLYVHYHDTEWGVPERDDEALFAKLILDGFQAGLSWITILRKRENFIKAFDGFNPETLARYGDADIARLLDDAGIIRSRAKIEASIGNAKSYLALRERGIGFSHFLWDFVDGEPVQNRFASMKEVPAETPVSQKMSKALKAEGFKFCGPVIVYAFMQATGLVNDHLVTCFRHEQVKTMGEPGMSHRLTLTAMLGVCAALVACAPNPRNVPPPEALNRTCGPGGGHGATGVMDWHCIDGDGEERLRPQPLTRVIRGDRLPDPDDTK